MIKFSENETQAIHGALRNYLGLEDLPENLKSASESALNKVKSNLKQLKSFDQAACDWRYNASCCADGNCADDCDMVCKYKSK